MPSEDTWTAQHNTIGTVWNGRIRSWINTPNFGSLPKDEKPVNSYTDTRWNVTSSYYNQGLWSKTSGWVGGYVNALYTCEQAAYFYYQSIYDRWGTEWAAAISGIENSSKLKALVKIADAKVNLAVAYAEASKTSNLILDTARRIDRAYRAFRRGDLKSIAENLNITPRKLHKSWLEYKYGWMPLLMDVKGAAEFFAQQHVIRPPRFKVTAIERVSKNYTSTVDYGVAYGGEPHTFANEATIANFQGKTVIWCELSSPHLSELQQLGLTNPALVAWELVPFSFVFDWFVQVGDWLTGLTALQGVTVRRAMYSTIESHVYASSRPATSREDVAYIYTLGQLDHTTTKRVYTRVSFIPDPLDLHPPVTNSFGFTKLVTSLALVRSGYRGNARL